MSTEQSFGTAPAAAAAKKTADHIGGYSRARKYTLPYRDVVRAKMILMAADGLSNDEIAARLDTGREIVSKWRKRFFQHGIAGLEERPRTGRRPASLAW